jgi:hypothetical protein
LNVGDRDNGIAAIIIIITTIIISIMNIIIIMIVIISYKNIFVATGIARCPSHAAHAHHSLSCNSSRRHHLGDLHIMQLNFGSILCSAGRKPAVAQVTIAWRVAWEV